MTERPLNNLEIYGGPDDGYITEMPVIEQGRPQFILLDDARYEIFRVEDCPDKHPKKGITHIGVFTNEPS